MPRRNKVKRNTDNKYAKRRKKRRGNKGGRE